MYYSFYQAGHYIPAIADFFLNLGKDTNYLGPDYIIPVSGLAIGNGNFFIRLFRIIVIASRNMNVKQFVSYAVIKYHTFLNCFYISIIGWSIPRIQYNYAEFAHNIGLITAPESVRLQRQYQVCVEQEALGDYSGRKACNIMGEVLAASGACPFEKAVSTDDDGDSNSSKIADPTSTNCFGPIVNYYDTRLYYGIGVQWPQGTDTVTTFLNLNSVRHAIHAHKYPETYSECDGAGGYLALMDGEGVEPQIINILESKVPIVFYNGQYDLICNHIGNEAMLDQLQWSGSSQFSTAKGYVWTMSDIVTSSNSTGDSSAEVQMIPAGYGRSTPDGLLTMLMVIGGSHMVPYDVPEAAADLIHRVINKISFSDYIQDLTYINYPPPGPASGGSNAIKTIMNDIVDPGIKIVDEEYSRNPNSLYYFVSVLCILACCCCIVKCCRTTKKKAQRGGELPLNYTPIPGNQQQPID